MAEQEAVQGQVEGTQSGEQQTEATPSAAQNTDSAESEHMIPKSRFDEVNRKLRELEAAQAQTAKERAEAERAQMEEQKRYQELYESERKRAADYERQAAELREAQRRAAIQSSIRQTAREAGFADPDDAVRFIPEAELQADEQGAVANVKQLIDRLAKDKPYLLASTQPAPGVQPGPKPAGGAAATDEDVRRLAAIYGVRPESIKQAMRR